jgi:hypothetical protein
MEETGSPRSQDDREGHEQSQGDTRDATHSGEGSASALAQLKSQARQHRHQAGDADDAPAAGGGHAQ